MKKPIAHSMANRVFSLDWHYTTGQVESLHRVDVSPRFQWIRGRFGLPCGMCYLDKRYAIEGGIGHVYEYMADLRLTVERRLTEAGYTERYVWRNVGNAPLTIEEEELGVYATFAEKYDVEAVTVPYRAYTHIMCAQGAFYMANARCDGSADGVGLVVTRGHIASVGAERLDPRQRGDLILYLPPCRLMPDQCVTLEWLVFGYDDMAQFWATVGRYAPKLQLSPRYPTPGQEVCVYVDERAVDSVLLDGRATANPFVCPATPFWLTLPAECAQNTPTECTDNAPIVGGENAPQSADKPDDDGVDAQQEAIGGGEEAPNDATPDLPDPADSAVPLGWYIRPCSHAALWASFYRSLGRGRNNPRRQLVLCEEALARFAHRQAQSTPDLALYQSAQSALLRYYSQGGLHRVDACLPAALLAADDTLRAYFVRQLHHAMARRKPLFSVQYVLAMYDMTRVGLALGLDCEAWHARFQHYARPILHTPFGDLVQ